MKMKTPPIRIDLEAIKKRFEQDPRRIFYSTMFGTAGDLLIAASNILVQIQPLSEIEELGPLVTKIREVARDLRIFRDLSDLVEKEMAKVA